MRQDYPIRYIEPVFRPPSEAQSLILPLTDGCSWNRCGFCEMYTAPQKRFRARAEREVLETIDQCADRFGAQVRRVFFADGDALVLSTRRLLNVLDAIRARLPSVHRISSYCLPRNLRGKSAADLKALAAAGLALVYVGAESGDDEVLAKVNKGETYASTLAALQRLGDAGIRRSVMILNGLGGAALSAQHAENSARLLNAAQPEFVSTLVVNFPGGEERFRSGFPQWSALPLAGLIGEMEGFVSRLDLNHTVFRSDHASNRLVLKGTLSADKQRLLAQIRLALEQPDAARLRPAWATGL